MIRLHQLVLAKLACEGIDIEGPWEPIEEALSQTVAPRRCIAAAREMREEQ